MNRSIPPANLDDSYTLATIAGMLCRHCQQGAYPLVERWGEFRHEWGVNSDLCKAAVIHRLTRSPEENERIMIEFIIHATYYCKPTLADKLHREHGIPFLAFLEARGSGELAKEEGRRCPCAPCTIEEA